MIHPLIRSVHIRETHVEIDKFQLQEMMKEFGIRTTGFDPRATEVKVDFVDVTEGGSLAYKVGTKCVIKLTEDQTKVCR